ncbi:hypothetical protein L2E82_09209 [Cichorium intybus]|uniref:Uncharacterized protein n=1 Tax=Cichorium intybus TaxID=13427 RepID=A0ACB9G8E9_CICIN|nr:hypothetical protein L2E82_09209 [Cichorium intybus]
MENKEETPIVKEEVREKHSPAPMKSMNLKGEEILEAINLLEGMEDSEDSCEEEDSVMQGEEEEEDPFDSSDEDSLEDS